MAHFIFIVTFQQDIHEIIDALFDFLRFSQDTKGPDEFRDIVEREELNVFFTFMQEFEVI